MLNESDKQENTKRTSDDDTLVYRNELLEEVAQLIESYKMPFFADTVASFAALVRDMKR